MAKETGGSLHNESGRHRKRKETFVGGDFETAKELFGVFLPNTQMNTPSGIKVEPGFYKALLQSRESNDYTFRTGNDEWRGHRYNSPIAAYDRFFEDVLKGKKISDLVAQREDAIVVDLMAPSGTLADLFWRLPRGPQRRGIAVSMTDQRDERERNRDNLFGITQIAGDLTEAKTWKKLEEELAGQKADLIIERGFGGLSKLPHHPLFFRHSMQRLWNNVSTDNGMMLLQIPSVNFHKTDIGKWKEKVLAAGIAVDINIQPGERNLNYKQLFMIKTPDSPKELPGL